MQEVRRAGGTHLAKQRVGQEARADALARPALLLPSRPSASLGPSLALGRFVALGGEQRHAWQVNHGR